MQNNVHHAKKKKLIQLTDKKVDISPPEHLKKFNHFAMSINQNLLTFNII